ncbi:hypothetical protein NDU88_002630 [Pleurodeles waltl]|uniref:Uncharacterized protein n=1 Tax=Pleurodeles waltl TaxID=8319 RepID=A0AAV7P8T8_PLEWA|nr:hypothetical protein NDU88_002630 [Pleurodeles waltl]
MERMSENDGHKQSCVLTGGGSRDHVDEGCRKALACYLQGPQSVQRSLGLRFRGGKEWRGPQERRKGAPRVTRNQQYLLRSISSTRIPKRKAMAKSRLAPNRKYIRDSGNMREEVKGQQVVMGMGTTKKWSPVRLRWRSRRREEGMDMK